MTNKKSISVEQLNVLLSDQYVLMTKVRNYHWNIVSPNFIQIHEYLDKLYSELSDQIDETAERIRVLGEKVEARMINFVENSQLSEEMNLNLSDKEIIENLVKDYKTINLSLYEYTKILWDNNDVVSEGMMIDLIETYEKTIWFLESHLA